MTLGDFSDLKRDKLNSGSISDQVVTCCIVMHPTQIILHSGFDENKSVYYDSRGFHVKKFSA